MPVLEDLCGRIDALVDRSQGRVIIGVVGLPGSGKTTFAATRDRADLILHDTGSGPVAPPP